VDISAGLPIHLTAPVWVPDPAVDNYGKAAAQILASRPWRLRPSTLPNSLAFVLPNRAAESVASLLQFGDFQIDNVDLTYGFTAKSRICNFNSTTGFSFSGFHHEYEPFDFEHPYDPALVTLTGIELNTRTLAPDEELERKNFLAFMFGEKDSFGDANVTGPTIIQSFCFKLPHLHPGRHLVFDSHDGL
jgi:hypothetical protein